MTEFRSRRLEEHRVGDTGSTMQSSYPVPRSPSGNVYRYSPNEKAGPRLFLLGQAPAERVVSEALRHRMRLEPGSDRTVCPYSGQIADDSAFVHFHGIEAIKEEIAWAVGADVQDYFAEFARSFNRRQRAGGLITLQMKTSSRREPKPVAIRTARIFFAICSAVSAGGPMRSMRLRSFVPTVAHRTWHCIFSAR